MPDPIIICNFAMTDTKVKQICIKSIQDKPGITMGFNSFYINTDNKDNLNAMSKMIVDAMQSKPTQQLSVSVRPDLLTDFKENVEYYISRTKNAGELMNIFGKTEFKSTVQKTVASPQQISQSLNDIDIRATYKDKNGTTLSLRNNIITDLKHHSSRDLLMALMKDLAEKMWSNNASIQSVTIPLEDQSDFKQAIKNYLQHNKEKDPDKSSKSGVKLKQLCDTIDKLQIIDSTAVKKMVETTTNNRSGPKI